MGSIPKPASAPSFPNPQGISKSNTTWTPPDLSGASTLAEIWEHHARHNPSHIWAVWHDPERSNGAASHGHTDTPIKVTYAEWYKALHRAARYLLSSLSLPAHPTHATDRKTVGILATPDSLTYTLLIQALIYLGHTAFPISSRNSPAAVVHLLDKTGCERLVVGGGEAVRELADKAEREVVVKSDGDAEKKLEMAQVPAFETLFPQYGPEGAQGAKVNGKEEFEYVKRTRTAAMDEPTIIIHSSGSTSFPKPIPFTQTVAVHWLSISWYGEGDMCGRTAGALSLPPFHAMGLLALIFLPFGSGSIAGVFKPYGPPTVPSAETMLTGIKETGTTVGIIVPSFLETMAEDEEAIKVLSKLDVVMYGGGPLPSSAGEKLVRGGVILASAYGTTEMGCPNRMGIPQRYNGLYDYMRFSKQPSYRLVPQQGLGGEEDTYELVMVANDHYTPSVFNVPGKKEFATNDLISLHPDDKELFKIVGRADDQIMLSTGEKTNPGPLERIIAASPLVQHAIMFGRAKTQSGILLQPSEGHEIDPSDEKQLAEFRAKVWTKIEEANAFAPQHSRIFKEMILVANSSKPFPMTPKNTVMRKAVVALYDSEIEACYEAVERSANVGSDIEVPTEWDQEQTLAFVRRIVTKVMERKEPPADEVDLFQVGLDSLQATYVRNSILSALRSAQIADVSRIAPNVVFEHPTIASLSKFLTNVASAPATANGVPDGTTSTDVPATHIAAMQEAIERYTKELPVHKPDDAYAVPKADEQVVILTGSTGGLGSHLLAQLVQKSTVKKVYALNRKSAKASLEQRQLDVLKERLGDEKEAEGVIGSEKVTLVEATLEREDLGISKELFEEIRTTTTVIIHNAWRLDFNLSLPSFAPQLDSVSNLVHLALRSPLRSPPHILFTSSVGTLSNWTSSSFVPEEPLTDLRISVGNGYGEGKEVGEKILEKVAQTTTVKTTNIRIGQLAGSSRSGAWATSDWVPLIVRGGQEVGALPDGQGPITWLAVDVAASAIIDMLHSSSQTLHIVHPNPSSWSTTMRTIGSVLNLPLVPFSEWVSKLEASANSLDQQGGGAASLRSNPSLALLDFYKHMGRAFEDAPKEFDVEGKEAGGIARLSTDKSTGESESLKNAPTITEQDAKRWIGYWRAKGFLKA